MELKKFHVEIKLDGMISLQSDIEFDSKEKLIDCLTMKNKNIIINGNPTLIYKERKFISMTIKEI